MSFARACGIEDADREQALEQAAHRISAEGLELVRFAWCDPHGMLRGKTLTAAAAASAMRDGVGMTGTMLLKDSSDRTAFKVFGPAASAELPGFAGAANLMLMADPGSFRVLPWTERTGWVQCQPWFADGTPVPQDSRRALQAALGLLAQQGLGLSCGLEVEFHIYRVLDRQAQLDPRLADWPGLPPEVQMIHPGYNLLSEQCFDQAEEPLRVVQRTAQALGLPLRSLEIELGPSQVEAVFEPTDALRAADNMVLFRSGVSQALRRAGYHASFMCRPPFPHVMSSGWHLHQSLTDLATGNTQMARPSPAPGSQANQASHVLSDLGEHYLAGLLRHARAATVFCTPTVNGYGRFRPNVMAPVAALWGRDNRGAMLRVIGQAGDEATHIENRLGEPAANPYLYISSQIHAGLLGLHQQLRAPAASDSPFDDGGARIPASLGEALAALHDDAAFCQSLGADLVHFYSRIKQSEWNRFEQATDPDEFMRREYFSRI